MLGPDLAFLERGTALQRAALGAAPHAGTLPALGTRFQPLGHASFLLLHLSASLDRPRMLSFFSLLAPQPQVIHLPQLWSELCSPFCSTRRQICVEAVRNQLEMESSIPDEIVWGICEMAYSSNRFPKT